MTPTQIANLEREFIDRANACKADDNHFGAAAYRNAAALLIAASDSKGRRRTFRPLDLSGKIGG